jgi:hypothetical protein
MKLRIKVIHIGMLLLTFSSFVTGIAAQKSETSSIMDITLCELLKNPEKYDEKVVRVKGIYRNFFELSELYCPDCYDENKRVWIESTEIRDECLSSRETKRLRKGKTLLVVFVGKFQASQSSYGHLNAYKFQIDVTCVEKSKILSKKEPLLPSELSNFNISGSCR